VHLEEDCPLVLQQRAIGLNGMEKRHARLAVFLGQSLRLPDLISRATDQQQ